MPLNQPSRVQAPPLHRRRDLRIDFFRGIALLCIFVDHIPGNVVARLTLHNWGFSDAAELFVLLAGVSAALAYARKANADRLILQRVGRIYLAHLALILMVGAMLALAALATGLPEIAGHPALYPFSQNFGRAVLSAAGLTLQPAFIDILPLYFVLLLALPQYLRLAKRSAVSALLVSAVIWAAANQFHVNLVADRDGGWFFNPLAWQFLFCIGVVIGLRNVGGSGAARLPRSPILFIAAIGLLVIALLMSAPWAQLPIAALRGFRPISPDFLGAISKTYASGWRIAHVLALAYVTAWLIPRDAAWLGSSWSGWLREIGRKPLTMFMLASICSYAASIVFMLCGRGLMIQGLCNLAGLLLLIVVANARQRLAPRLEVVLRKVDSILWPGEAACRTIVR